MERNLDFDTVIDRGNTKCLKYDFAKMRGMPEDVLPMWVADMDFKTSSYVEDAIVEWAGRGIFGYSEVQTPYFETVRKWMKEQHGWEPQENGRKVVSSDLYLGEDNRYHIDLAGMMLSNIFIPNQTLRRKFRRELDAAGISQLGIMGLVACEAAYSRGRKWYQAMMSYVNDNIAFTRQYVKTHSHGMYRQVIGVPYKMQ